MGCDDYPLFRDADEMLDGSYRLEECVAELWSPALARRFPNIDHRACFQAMRLIDGIYNPQPFNPPRCQDWHCPRCGKACNMYGHHDCQAGS